MRRTTRGYRSAIVTWVVVMACVSATAQQNLLPLSVLDEPLPILIAGIEVHIPLHATGGVPPYHWSVVSGDLPPGITLDPTGVLIGHATKAGAFSVTVNVTDSAHPANTMNKELRTEVTAALVLDWSRPPQVHGNSIDGAVQVSNGSKDDFDLTVIIVAVNEIGRATALGYRHLTFKAGTSNFEIPFGATPGVGAYIVHADAVAEIPSKNTILRQRMQTPAPLKIVQGP